MISTQKFPGSRSLAEALEAMCGRPGITRSPAHCVGYVLKWLKRGMVRRYQVAFGIVVQDFRGNWNLQKDFILRFVLVDLSSLVIQKEHVTARRCHLIALLHCRGHRGRCRLWLLLDNTIATSTNDNEDRESNGLHISNQRAQVDA